MAFFLREIKITSRGICKLALWHVYGGEKKREKYCHSSWRCFFFVDGIFSSCHDS